MLIINNDKLLQIRLPFANTRFLIIWLAHKSLRSFMSGSDLKYWLLMEDLVHLDLLNAVLLFAGQILVFCFCVFVPQSSAV